MCEMVTNIQKNQILYNHEEMKLINYTKNELNILNKNLITSLIKHDIVLSE